MATRRGQSRFTMGCLIAFIAALMLSIVIYAAMVFIGAPTDAPEDAPQDVDPVGLLEEPQSPILQGDGKTYLS